MAFNLDDYNDVADRIAEFNAKYPEGSLQSELTPLEHEGRLVGWLCRAYAYRTADDERPGIGHAVEPVPGKTPYTKDSEAMNAETSAWGRAIVALGFKTKKIASKQEVEAREAPRRQAKKEPANGSESSVDTKYATEPQRKRLFAIAKEHAVESARLREIIAHVTGQESTAQIPAAKYDDVIKAIEMETVPFA